MWLQKSGISHIKVLEIVYFKCVHGLVNRTLKGKGLVPGNYQRPYSTLNVSGIDNCFPKFSITISQKSVDTIEKLELIGKLH